VPDKCIGESTGRMTYSAALEFMKHYFDHSKEATQQNINIWFSRTKHNSSLGFYLIKLLADIIAQIMNTIG